MLNDCEMKTTPENRCSSSTLLRDSDTAEPHGNNSPSLSNRAEDQPTSCDDQQQRESGKEVVSSPADHDDANDDNKEKTQDEEDEEDDDEEEEEYYDDEEDEEYYDDEEDEDEYNDDDDGDENDDDEQDELAVHIHVVRPVYLSQPPECRLWDVLNSDHPVPPELLKRVPVEIWHMILSFVPLARLSLLTRVSKGWQTMIDGLYIWQEIATRNEMGRPAGNIATYKDVVLGQVVVLCDVCLERSREYGVHLPIPVQRPDLLGLVWMCKQCRDAYGATHPEIMSSRAAQENEVFIQGPQTAEIRQRLRPVYRRSHYGYGYRYHDDFSDFYDSDDYDDFSDGSEYDYEMRAEKVWTQWSNKKDPQTWLNQHLRRGRLRMMQTLLGIHGLCVRNDSKLTNDFIGGCAQYDPYAVADVMAEMAWFFDKTAYADFCKQSPEAGKIRALAHWAKDLYSNHRGEECLRLQSFESLKGGLAPPQSLWSKALCAVEEVHRVEMEITNAAEKRKAEWDSWNAGREERRKARLAEKRKRTQQTVQEPAPEEEEDNEVNVGESEESEFEGSYDGNSSDSYWRSDWSPGFSRVQSALRTGFSFKVDVDIKEH